MAEVSPVAVVVATRNRAVELDATLERLGSVCGRAPLLVVDNASDDGTASRVVALSTLRALGRSTFDRSARAGLGEALRGLPRVLAERRRLPARVEADLRRVHRQSL